MNISSNELKRLLREVLRHELNNSNNQLSSNLQANRANVDNAGRQEFSSSVPLGEYVLDRGLMPSFFNQQVVAGGGIAYDAGLNGATLDVTASGDGAIYQTYQRHPYFPGHAQQAEFTFIGFTPQTNVTKRVGYFSSSTISPYTADLDGIFLESSNGNVKLVISKTGALSEVSQDRWLDPLDGSGASGITINWNNFQVFMIDFLYLGGTYVNLYYISEGKRHLVHRYNHSNKFADTILSTPTQPIRAEISSNGGAGEFTFACAQVSTMGLSQDFAGDPVYADTGATLSVVTSGTEYVALAFRKRVPNAEFFPTLASVTSISGVTAPYIMRIHINPTLSGALSFSQIGNTDMDVAIGGGESVTGDGHIIYSNSGVGRSVQSIESIGRSLRVGQAVNGTYQTFVLTYTPLTNNQDFVASLGGVLI